MELSKKTILGVGVTDASKKDILEYIINSLKKSTKPYYIVTPNPEIIVLTTKSNDFKKVVNNAEIATNDGVGVGLAAKIVGKSLHGRFSGLELVEKVCEKGNDWPITVGFLGGRRGVAEKAVECLRAKYPKLHVGFVGDEWPEDRQLHTVKHIDILFVAYGAPKQEMWMADHVGEIPVTVMVGVGGSFDQIANPSLRPPRIVQNLGFGWLYRLIRQPWRLKRQLALVEFMWLVLQSVISKK